MGIKVELIGIRMYGPPPIGRTEVEAFTGFTALGGVNGAGKSTLLAALGEALSGELHNLEAAELIFQLSDGADTSEDLLLLRRLGFNARVGAPTNAEDVGMYLYENSRDQRGSRNASGGLQFWDEVAAEVQDQCCLSLIMARNPAGSTRVTTAISGRPSEKTPILFDFVTEMVNSGSGSVSQGSIRQWTRLFGGRDNATGLLQWAIASDLPFPLVPIRERFVTPRNEPHKRERLTPYTVEVLQPNEELERTTSEAFARHSEAPVFTRISGMDEPVDVDYTPERILEIAQRWVRLISERATITWKRLRPDQAQPLMCTVSSDPAAWIEGRLFEWSTSDGSVGASYPASRLSSGLIRWASLAIGFAVDDDALWRDAIDVARQSPLFAESSWFESHFVSPSASIRHWWLLDEPELGLHRFAEERVAEALKSVAADPASAISIVAATHSPALLAGADGRRRVSRTRSGLEVHPVNNVPGDLAQLGLQPADLMGWYRGFLIVEGPHDVAALHGFIGDELANRRIKVLFAGGARLMAGTLDSQFVLEASNAALMCAIDGIGSTEAAALWSEAQYAAGESFGALNEALRRGTAHLGPAEGKGIRDFARTACKHPEAFRFTLLGLPKPDVLLYFTPNYLSPAMPISWDEVASTLGGDKSTGVNTGTWKPDKKQLTARFGFDADEDLTEAARKTRKHSGVPTDFLELLRHIDAHMESVDRQGAQLS